MIPKEVEAQLTDIVFIFIYSDVGKFLTSARNITKLTTIYQGDLLISTRSLVI